MGQHASVGAAAGAARRERGGEVRAFGRLALALAAGVVVGAGAFAVVDRAVEEVGQAEQQAVVSVEGNREATAELVEEKAALVADGAASGVADVEVPVWVEPYVGEVGGSVGATSAAGANARVRADAGVADVEVPVWVTPYVGEAGEGVRSRADQGATWSEDAAAAEAANQLRRAG